MTASHQKTDTSFRPTQLKSHLPVVVITLLGAIPFSMVLFLPMFVGGMITNLNFSEREAGLIASADMAGFAIAALPAYFWIPRFDMKRILSCAYIGLCLVNLACIYITVPEQMLVVRFLAGFVAGTSSAGIVATIAQTTNPDRVYGIWLAGQLLYGTLGYLAIPGAFSYWGLNSVFIAMAFLSFAALSLIRWFPAYSRGETVKSIDVNNGLNSYKPMWGVVSLFSFYIGLNIVWGFLERIGAKSGLSTEVIGDSLAVANIAGLAGATFVSILGTSIGRKIPLVIAIILTAVSLLLLLDGASSLFYMLSTSVYLAGWCFIVPLMFGAIAETDHSGKYVILGNAVIGAGLTLGPALGAILIVDSDYNRIILISVICITASLFLILPLLNQVRPVNE